MSHFRLIRCRSVMLILVVLGGPLVAAWADEVRYTTDENGVTYRETRRVIRRPTMETRIEERQQTVYAERQSTELHPSYRTIYTPVTEYRWEPYLANRWNPLAQPYWAYRFVPHTRWETRTEEHRVPVVRREWVPEQRSVQVPVVTHRVVDEEIISRVAVSGGAGGGDPFATSPGTSVVRRDTVGGVGRLENDPPRTGTAWRPADPTPRR
jgi:hypothetical protein